MDYQKLWDLIKGPPFCDLDAAECAAACRAKTVKRLRPLSSAQLLAWAGQAGRLARIEQAAESRSDQLKSIAKAALKLIDRDGTRLDLNLPDRAGMVDALVAAGVLTAEEKADLCALATERISPAEAAGLAEVYKGHVTKARAQHG